MAIKKTYYFFKIVNDVIISVGKGFRVPKSYIEVIKADYDRYHDIVESVEERDGYNKVVTVYSDFSYTVEYVPVEVFDEE